MFAHDEHLTQMGLGGGMTFETVLVSTLFFTDLAEPSETLETLGFHFVRYVLRGSDWEMMGSETLK